MRASGTHDTFTDLMLPNYITLEAGGKEQSLRREFTLCPIAPLAEHQSDVLGFLCFKGHLGTMGRTGCRGRVDVGSIWRKPML